MLVKPFVSVSDWSRTSTSKNGRKRERRRRGRRRREKRRKRMRVMVGEIVFAISWPLVGEQSLT